MVSKSEAIHVGDIDQSYTNRMSEMKLAMESRKRTCRFPNILDQNCVNQKGHKKKCEDKFYPIYNLEGCTHGRY